MRVTATLDSLHDSIFLVYYDESIPPADIGKIIVLADLSNVCNLWGRHKVNLILSSLNNTITIPIESIFTYPFSEVSLNKPKIMTPVDYYTVFKSSMWYLKFAI